MSARRAKCSGELRCVAAVAFALAAGALPPLGVAAVGPNRPNGFGPQTLWPTPALEFWDPRAEKFGAPLTAYVRSLADEAASEAAPIKSGWRSHGRQFLEETLALASTPAPGARHAPVVATGTIASAAASAAYGLRQYLEASLRRYLREALNGSSATGIVEIDIEDSWASFSSRGMYQAPHIEPKAGLTGTYYASCGSSGAASKCEIRLEDPRTPAATADMPDIVRERLGFGGARSFKLRPGSVLIHPAFILHAGVPSSSDGERVAISFTASIRHSPKTSGNKGELIVQVASARSDRKPREEL